METKIIESANKNEWNNIISKAYLYDFYHCNSYSRLDTSGDAFLFVVEDDEDFIALPLIKRSIEGTELYDCTSVYGYAGPVASKPSEELNPKLIIFFQQRLYHYLKENNIISVFSRLHPIIQQTYLLKELGSIIPLNQTVVIDVTQPPEVQRRQYRKSNKSEINQLRKNGYIIKKADNAEEINTFAQIYTETMLRVNAVDHYFFDLNYFLNFLNVNDFSSMLLLAYKEQEIVAGAIFTIANTIMQYHLAGTTERYLKNAPMKLIIDEARLLATGRQLAYFHLGGGVGGSDNDPLFKFKSGFSNLNYTFQVWKWIVDKEKYDELAAIRSYEKQINPNFFPLYRG